MPGPVGAAADDHRLLKIDFVPGDRTGGGAVAGRVADLMRAGRGVGVLGAGENARGEIEARVRRVGEAGDQVAGGTDDAHIGAVPGVVRGATRDGRSVLVDLEGDRPGRCRVVRLVRNDSAAC